MVYQSEIRFKIYSCLVSLDRFLGPIKKFQSHFRLMFEPMNIGIFKYPLATFGAFEALGFLLYFVVKKKNKMKKN